MPYNFILIAVTTHTTVLTEIIPTAVQLYILLYLLATIGEDLLYPYMHYSDVALCHNVYTFLPLY